MEEFIDIDRIQRRLDRLWDIGKTADGGVSRLAYSDEENEAVSYIVSELPEEYTVREDAIGNVFATYRPDADRSVFVGSHLDSVVNGGRLDGALGVVVALEAIEAVRAAGAEDPWRTPTLAVFRAEESTRFGQHTIGSRGALGLLTVEELASTDQNGIPLWQAMNRAGFQPTDLSEPTLELADVAGFMELHIEQGRVLDEAGDRLGVVTSIRAPVRYRVTVAGEYDHSGATPMGIRKDAIAGAAEMILAIERLGEEAASDGDVVVTVGDVTAVSGGINTVCGEVRFPIDIRSNDEAYRDEVEARLLDRIDSIAADRDLSLETDPIARSSPVSLDDGMTAAIATAADAVGTTYRRLPSGGGHDAMNFQLAGIPTGMVFVPSVGGVSHNPEEATEEAAIIDATAVLAWTIRNGPSPAPG